jgi:hypothetical protein
MALLDAPDFFKGITGVFRKPGDGQAEEMYRAQESAAGALLAVISLFQRPAKKECGCDDGHDEATSYDHSNDSEIGRQQFGKSSTSTESLYPFSHLSKQRKKSSQTYLFESHLDKCIVPARSAISAGPTMEVPHGTRDELCRAYEMLPMRTQNQQRRGMDFFSVQIILIH